MSLSDLKCVIKPAGRFLLNENSLHSVSCEFGIDISEGDCIEAISFEGATSEAGSFDLVKSNLGKDSEGAGGKNTAGSHIGHGY